MAKQTLSAKSRKITGRKVKQLRNQGQVPANVFGKDVKSSTIQVDEKELAKLLKDAGESTLVYLDVEGEKEDRPVMISELRRDPVSGQIQHVALRQVNLKEKTTAPVTVKLVGEATAEVEKLGILVQQIDEVEVEALPADMPEVLEVDVSLLAAVDDAVYVKDIKTTDKAKILTDQEDLVAKIEPLAAEEPKEAPAPVEVEGEAKAEEGEEKPAEAEAAEEKEPAS